MTRRWICTLVPVLALAASAALGLWVAGGIGGHDDATDDARGVAPDNATAHPGAAGSTGASPAAFLRTYVDQDGRVVRHDQGGDTVSEGQAYAMLIALGSDRPHVFAQVWSWTRTHLQRRDGLLAWRWDGGKVVGHTSAADADLDAARALALAGHRYGRPAWTHAAATMGRAILDEETVPTHLGRILVAGSWATTSPYAFDPSYVSAASFRILDRIAPDPRWHQVETGSRAAIDALTPAGQLPPDWAQVSTDGTVHPWAGPSGGQVVFGYDAARTVVRSAQDCDPADGRRAAAWIRILQGRNTVAFYDLGGAPQTSDASALMSVARAAGLAAGGRSADARASLDTAAADQKRAPTYYGGAWAALGPMLLGGTRVGGCAPLARQS